MKNITIKQNRTESFNLLLLAFSLTLVLIITTGCGVRNANVEPGEAVSVEQFSGKKIAILPVHGDESVGTDSQLQLKKNINTKLDKKLSEYLPKSEIIGAKKTIPILNKNNKLTVFDDLVKPYKSVGVFDSQIVESLFKLLNCDYLAISTLDNESIDVVAVNAYLISLDVIIIDRNNEIV